MPSFPRHPSTTAATDDRDRRLAADGPVHVRGQADDRTVHRSRTAELPVIEATTERIHPQRFEGGQAFGAQIADRGPATVDTAPPVPAGPRPRASLLATLGLVAGVVAALFVLSGTLAGYGVALGVLALLLSVGGVSATGRRHVAGKVDALIGLTLGLGAIVVGILTVTGSLSWLTTDTEAVDRLKEWLDTQFTDRFGG